MAACGGGADETITDDGNRVDAGGNGGGGGGGDGGGGGPDGGSGPGSGACLADSDYGAATLANATAQGGAAEFVVLVAPLNAGDTRDELFLELYAPEQGSIAPGTYELAGDELNYSTCSVCVLLYTDVSADGELTDDAYFATAGTVQITAVTPNLAGTITGIALEHVTIDAESVSTPHSDGCTSAIASGSFDAPVEALPPKPRQPRVGP